jgi:hypothetical protein
MQKINSHNLILDYEIKNNIKRENSLSIHSSHDIESSINNFNYDQTAQKYQKDSTDGLVFLNN